MSTTGAITHDEAGGHSPGTAAPGAPGAVGTRGAPDTRKGRDRPRRGEQLMVPRATFDSYYDRPILAEPVWEAREVAGYFFLGGLSGASSVLAVGADLTGRPALAKACSVGAAGAITLSLGALVKDLGRPARFLNMMRVLKPTSPMSVGTWVLAGYAPAAGICAVSRLTGLMPRVGSAGALGAALLGPAVATYTSVLLADTAVPAWHGALEELPVVFAGSSAASAGGLGMLAAPVAQALPARRLAVLGAVVELLAGQRMERRLGEVGEVYRTGPAAELQRAARLLTGAGAALALTAGRRSRAAAAAGGAALLAGSACTRFAVFEAGRASTRDPRYVVRPQRERLADRGAPA